MSADLSWRPGPECLAHWAKVREKIQANPTQIKSQPLAYQRIPVLEAELIELKRQLRKLWE
ncbi:hypothetical protein [Bradyrhizobium sp. SZCCHNS3053]|uniref:hypothetical protein n=1 Tax=Bradyrhizobium sp. SZCCHNS3053 TaxID=3057322 RepID=UPI002916F8CC|nr:hypothetical protein [Bradyrhizobium sp. SZCCHNS3053]